MLLAIALVCSCFYILGFISNQIGKTLLERQIARTMKARVDFWAEKMEQEMESLLITQSSLVSDSNLLELYVLGDHMSDYAQIDAVKQLSYRLMNVKILHKIVSSIEVFFPKQNMRISADSPIKDSYDKDAFYDYQTVYFGEKQTLYLTIFSPIYIGNPLKQTPNFYIRVEVTPKTIENLLNEWKGEESGLLYMMTADGDMIVGGEQERELWKERVNDQKDGIGFKNGKFWAASYIKRIDSWILYEDNSNEWMKQQRYYTYLNGIFAILALALLLAYACYAKKAFIKPINRIFHAMEEANKKETFFICDGGKDEFDIIYSRYNLLVKKTEALIQENLDAKYREHIAQLRQLQYQIQPHFLYNSIFLIYRMAKMNEEEEIAEYAGHLGKYYQYITRICGNEVPIEDEMAHIKNYLAIQKTRFGDRILVDMDPLPQSMKGKKIIPLILQPLVENAYEHGVKNLVQDGLVSIHMEYREGWFLFTVEDNGKGMDENELKELKKRMEEGRIEYEIHAISNTNVRLKLYYGKESRLILKNREAGGFCVCAQIHMEKLGEKIVETGRNRTGE